MAAVLERPRHFDFIVIRPDRPSPMAEAMMRDRWERPSTAMVIFLALLLSVTFHLTAMAWFLS